MNQTESQQQGTDLRLMLAQADALCLERRFEEAATIYQQLVTMAEVRLGPNHPDAILVLQRLADSLYAMNLFRDCLPLYERLCSVARGMLGDSDPDVINLMFKVAKTQELVGSFSEAQATYQFAINISSANLPPGHELTTQLKERYKLLLDQMEENKRAAQNWKENTVTNPVITMGPDGKPIPPPSMAPMQQSPPPLMQMPSLQQIPPVQGVSQSMIGQLPPHLASGPNPAPFNPGQPDGNSPGMPSSPFGAEPVHPAGSPFADHPPGSPFGDQSFGAPPAVSQSAPPPVMASPQGSSPQSNPWDSGPSSGLPPSAMMPPVSASQQIQAPAYQQQMPPIPHMAPQQPPPGMPPLPQMLPQQPPPGMPPFPQMATQEPPPGMSPFPQMATQEPPPGMPPFPQMAPQQPAPGMPPLPQMQPSMAPPQQLPPPFPPAPQGMPPSPQSMPLSDFGDPLNPIRSAPSSPLAQAPFPGGPPTNPMTDGMQPPWNAGQNQTGTGSIGDQIMQDFEFDSGVNSMPQSLSLPPVGNPPAVQNLAPNMMPMDGKGNPGFGSNNAPPSGFPPLPQSMYPEPNAGVMQDPFRSNRGPSSADDQFSSEPGAGLYTAGPEPVRSLTPPLPSSPPVHQTGLLGGPVTDPLSETGRKSIPDPYLDHLALKVANLKQAQLPEYDEQPMSPESRARSSGWHDAISVPADRGQSQEIQMHRKGGAPPILFDEGTEYGDFDENQIDDRDRVTSTKKIKSSRAAASKSEDLVSNVRAFKEYLIPMVVILVIGVGGYFFLSNTVARPSVSTGESAVPSVAPSKEQKTVYATPDNTLRLAVGSRECSYVDGKTLINVPCVVYDGSWSHAAMQIIDSVMEKQLWFNQVPEGMVTDNGTILFDTKAPDRMVMDQMNRMALTANASYKAGAGYPVKAASINSQNFVYRNPFTGSTGLVKLQVFHEVNGNRQEFINSMLNGSLVLGEQKFGRGDVRVYALGDPSGGGVEKGLGFFVRGADRNGNLFKVSNTGESVLLGFVEGKDISNSHIQPVEAALTPTTPLKPTKVWIAKGQQLPIFVIYHSLPISMAIVAFLTFWRSLMVAPGQDPNNSLNRTFRLISFGAIGIGIISAIIQYTFWM